MKPKKFVFLNYFKTVRAKKNHAKAKSELAAKQNELTPQQTEKITATKQTLQIDVAGYVSHFKIIGVFV